MPAFSTCDLCDANEEKMASGEMAVLPPRLQPYGARPAFSGPAFTLKVFEDNVLLRATLETPGEGRVLVVDGGGSLRCALVGGNLGMLAEKNGWVGVVVDGCVRDIAELRQCQVGIWALGSNPRRSLRKGAGVTGLRVEIAGVAVAPGDWIYADEDGIVVSRSALA